jgi:hypothetical protein
MELFQSIEPRIPVDSTLRARYGAAERGDKTNGHKTDSVSGAMHHMGTTPFETRFVQRPPEYQAGDRETFRHDSVC